MSVNIEEIKQKLYKKLEKSGWGDKLKTFIYSQDFDRIMEYLVNESAQGKKFVPELKYMFNAFEQCPFNKLKVVIVGQDPYPKINVSDGMAFSCSREKKEEKSLMYIFNEIQEKIDPDYKRDPDLTRWANQGVLLLNSALTTTANKPGMHQQLWRPFMAFVFDTITIYKPGLAYVFMGRKAKDWSVSIPDNNHKQDVFHPVAAGYTHEGSWNSEDCFNKVNKYLLSIKEKEIKW